MFIPHTTIDEIASIRRKIAELRAREAALETRLVSTATSSVLPGLTANARIEINVHNVLDISRLPRDILNNPKYYVARQITSLRIEPHENNIDPSLFTAPKAPKSSSTEAISATDTPQMPTRH